MNQTSAGRIHPADALFAGEKAVPTLPACEHFAGSEVSDYLANVYSKKFRTSTKPQYVDRLPAVFKGPVVDLLRKVEERMKLDEVVELLELEEAIKRNMTDLSGGELLEHPVAEVGKGARLAGDGPRVPVRSYA